MTFKNLIFGNFWGTEVVGSSLYQKNIGAELTLIYIGLHCVNRSLCSATTLATLVWGLAVQFRDADNSCLELTVLIYILYLGGAFGICVTDTCNNCDYHKAREHLYWYAYCPGKMMMVSYKILLHSRPYSNAIAIKEFHNILIKDGFRGNNPSILWMLPPPESFFVCKNKSSEDRVGKSFQNIPISTVQ